MDSEDEAQEPYVIEGIEACCEMYKEENEYLHAHIAVLEEDIVNKEQTICELIKIPKYACDGLGISPK